MKHFTVCAVLAIVAPAFAADRPNIVFMLTDDQGWSGLSVAIHPEGPASALTAFTIAMHAAGGCRKVKLPVRCSHAIPDGQGIHIVFIQSFAIRR